MELYLDALPTANWIDLASLAAFIVQLTTTILLILRYKIQTDAIQKAHIRNLLYGNFAGIGSLALANAITWYSYVSLDYKEYTFAWYLYLVGAALSIYIPFLIFSPPNSQERTRIEHEIDLQKKSTAVKNGVSLAGSDKFDVSIRPQKIFTWQWNPAILNVKYDSQMIQISREGKEDIVLHHSEIKKVKIISDDKIAKITSTKGDKYQINFAANGTSKQGRSLATTEEEFNFQRFKKLWNAAYQH